MNIFTHFKSLKCIFKRLRVVYALIRVVGDKNIVHSESYDANEIYIKFYSTQCYNIL